MLSLSVDDIEKYTRPLCSKTQFEKKIENYKKVEDAFADRKEQCEGLPIHLHLEASGDCNLYCPICPRGRQLIERNGFLSFADFARVFAPLHEALCNIIVSGFGEPLLNSETTKMIEHASKNTVSTFMNTNGTVIQEWVGPVLDAQLTLINISLDGTTSKSCHKYNDQFPFTKVVKGVERLRAEKDKGNYAYPVIIGQFIVNEETVDEMEQLEKWALGIGIEQVKFKRKHPTMPGEVEREKIFSEYDYSKLIKEKKVNSSEKLNWSPIDCSHPWDSMFLSCTGEIGICSFDPHQLMKLNHSDGDFAFTWNNDFIKKVRRWHAGMEQVQAPCSKCNRLPGYLMPEKM